MDVKIVNGKAFIKDRIYEIDFTCGHYNSLEALERGLSFLVPGDEVRFICPVSNISGVYARVEKLSTGEIMDIDTNYIGREIEHEEDRFEFEQTFI